MFAGVNPLYNHAHHVHPDFQDIIDEYTVQLDNKLEALFNAYIALLPAEKTLVQTAYNNNNNISSVCSTAVRPYKYDELPAGIIPTVKALYDKLWEKVLGYKVVRDSCGTVKEHFNAFRVANTNSVCPFCGLDSLLCEHDDGRDDYDHYIPKAQYPFCSVNFNNLIPVCHNCNSKNKGQKDSPFTPNSNPLTQRELYYPYAAIAGHSINVSITSANTDLNNPHSWILNVSCLPAANNSKKDSWMEIYNIETRYKAKIAKDSYKWKERIIKKYQMRCVQNGMPFLTFKNDILDDYLDYPNINNGIVMKCFDEFIMNDPNCEANLQGVI
ncbi:MAG: hypothetical protein WBM13_00030 [Bacteroidia bacterium]